jgi:hypothetical protein
MKTDFLKNDPLFKVLGTSESGTETSVTSAMETSKGCIVRTTTEFRSNDTIQQITDNVVFVPAAKLLKQEDETYKLE